MIGHEVQRTCIIVYIIYVSQFSREFKSLLTGLQEADEILRSLANESCKIFTVLPLHVQFYSVFEALRQVDIITLSTQLTNYYVGNLVR